MKTNHSCVQCGKDTDSISSDFCSEHCRREQFRMLEYVGPSQADTIFWNQYRFLQHELIESLKFVAPNTDNYAVYSDKYLSIIRGACSEIDSACKRIVGNSETNMKDWRIYLEHKYNISRVCISVPLFQTYIRPFRNFEIEKSPNWWLAFTELKHQRDSSFNKATLENAICCMGALLILNVILLEPVFKKIDSLKGQIPAYSDLGILSEIEIFFRLWGQGISSTTCAGANGVITLYSICERT